MPSRKRRARRLSRKLPVALVALLLAACGSDPEPKLPPEVRATVTPAPRAPAAAAAGEGIASAEGQAEGPTPLNERVATLGLLNKRNNLTEDIKLRPGQSQRFDNVIVKLDSCERTAPWEHPPETGAFVQVFVQERESVREPLAWRKIFSGWLFKNSPSLNVVEHPVYDVWVKECAMNFPGEESSPASAASDSKAANPAGRPAPKAGSTPRSSPSPRPAPSPSPPTNPA